MGTIDAYTWTNYKGEKDKCQAAVATDDTSANTRLLTPIKRSNLLDVNKAELLEMFEEKAALCEELEQKDDAEQWMKLLKTFQELKSTEDDDVFSEDEDDDESGDEKEEVIEEQVQDVAKKDVADVQSTQKSAESVNAE